MTWLSHLFDPSPMLLAGAGVLAAIATAANHILVHDLATICGSLATVLSIMAAVLSARSKKPTRRKRVVPPVK